jgi:hypothetical protein
MRELGTACPPVALKSRQGATRNATAAERGQGAAYNSDHVAPGQCPCRAHHMVRALLYYIPTLGESLELQCDFLMDAGHWRTVILRAVRGFGASPKSANAEQESIYLTIIEVFT